MYRGQPDGTRDPKAYGAFRRQTAAWSRDPRITIVSRPLHYPRDYPATRPEEKGVDVQLVVDVIAMAIRGQYDIGVLMSEDTDLKPALEAVVETPCNVTHAMRGGRMESAKQCSPATAYPKHEFVVPPAG